MKKGLLSLFSAVVMIFMLAACNTNTEEGTMDPEGTEFNQVSYGPGHGTGQNPGNGVAPGPQDSNGNGVGQNRFDVNLTGEGMDSNGGNDQEGRDGRDGRDGQNGQAQGPNAYNQADQGNNQDQTGTNNQRVDQVNGAFQQEVVKLTNQARKKNGLSPLKSSAEVGKVAQKKAQDMAANNYFSHTSPTYGSPFDMLKQFGVDYSTAAENIAAGQQTPDEVVKKWLASPGHRKNIMNKNLTHIGVGYSEDGQTWTQMFIGK